MDKIKESYRSSCFDSSNAFLRGSDPTSDEQLHEGYGAEAGKITYKSKP